MVTPIILGLLVGIVIWLFIRSRSRVVPPARPMSRAERVRAEMLNPLLARARRRYQLDEVLHLGTALFGLYHMGARADIGNLEYANNKLQQGRITLGQHAAFEQRYNGIQDEVGTPQFEDVAKIVMPLLKVDDDPQTGSAPPAVTATRAPRYFISENIQRLMITGLLVAFLGLLLLGGCVYSVKEIAKDPRVTPSHERIGTSMGTVKEGVVAASAQKQVKVVVPGNRYGYTRVTVDPGTYKVSATGRIHWDDSVDPDGSGPEGADWTPNSGGAKRTSQFPMPNAPIAGLICRLGDDLIFVGKGTTITTEAGVIDLGYNERWGPDFVQDNYGSTTVVLERIA